MIDDPAHDNLYLIFEGLPGRQLMEWNEASCTYSARPSERRSLRLRHWFSIKSARKKAISC